MAGSVSAKEMVVSSIRSRYPEQFQYLTFGFRYYFKRKKGEILSIKICNPSKEVLFKGKFPCAQIQGSAESFSEESAATILSLLVAQKKMPERFLPSIPKAAIVYASQPQEAVGSSDPLDPKTVQMLQELSKRSQALFEALEADEEQNIQKVLIDNKGALYNLLFSQNQEDQALAEVMQFQRKGSPYKYYQTFQQKLTGVCIAASAIQSGMVENARVTPSGYVAKVLGEAGQAIPVAGYGLRIISQIFKLKNIRDNHREISRLTHFFADFNQSLHNIKTIARILTREQEKEILQCAGKPAGMIAVLKDWFTGDESTNPVIVKAAEDCQTFLVGILAGELSSQASPEETVSHILRRSLSKTVPPLASPASLPAPPISHADLARRDEVERLRAELEVLKREGVLREKRLEEAEKRAARAHAAAEALFGPIDDGDQLRLQSLSERDSSGARAPFRAIRATVDRLEDCARNAALAAAEALERVNALEEKQ